MSSPAATASDPPRGPRGRVILRVVSFNNEVISEQFLSKLSGGLSARNGHSVHDFFDQ